MIRELDLWWSRDRISKLRKTLKVPTSARYATVTDLLKDYFPTLDTEQLKSLAWTYQETGFFLFEPRDKEHEEELKRTRRLKLEDLLDRHKRIKRKVL